MLDRWELHSFQWYSSRSEDLHRMNEGLLMGDIVTGQFTAPLYWLPSTKQDEMAHCINECYS